jgi:hypothetical protein
MRDYRVGEILNPSLPLARAVAASSAFPPVLSPCGIDLSKYGLKFQTSDGTEDLNNEPYTTKLFLSDGGVYDNPGLETAWKRFDTILVSDGGGHFAPDPAPIGRGTRLPGSKFVAERQGHNRIVLKWTEAAVDLRLFGLDAGLNSGVGGRVQTSNLRTGEAGASGQTEQRLWRSFKHHSRIEIESEVSLAPWQHVAESQQDHGGDPVEGHRANSRYRIRLATVVGCAPESECLASRNSRIGRPLIPVIDQNSRTDMEAAFNVLIEGNLRRPEFQLRGVIDAVLAEAVTVVEKMKSGTQV